jgi:hypothetical protein
MDPININKCTCNKFNDNLVYKTEPSHLRFFQWWLCRTLSSQDIALRSPLKDNQHYEGKRNLRLHNQHEVGGKQTLNLNGPTAP